MSWTSDLLVGIAEYGAAHSGGTWDPDGAYTAGQTGILLVFAPDSPDRIVVLTPTWTTEDGDDGDVLQGLQIRTRGDRNDPMSTLNLRDVWRDCLDGLGNDGITLIGGVTVSDITHIPGAGVSLGIDASQRLEWSDNYQIRAARPTALRN